MTLAFRSPTGQRVGKMFAEMCRNCCWAGLGKTSPSQEQRWQVWRSGGTRGRTGTAFKQNTCFHSQHRPSSEQHCISTNTCDDPSLLWCLIKTKKKVDLLICSQSFQALVFHMSKKMVNNSRQYNWNWRKHTVTTSFLKGTTGNCCKFVLNILQRQQKEKLKSTGTSQTSSFLGRGRINEPRKLTSSCHLEHLELCLLCQGGWLRSRGCWDSCGFDGCPIWPF